MTDFIGYTAEIDRVGYPKRKYDFTKETLLRQGVEYHEIPFCPLAVIGKMQSKLTRAELDAFLHNDLIIHVIDVAKGTKYEYDYQQMAHELDMEILAG